MKPLQRITLSRQSVGWLVHYGKTGLWKWWSYSPQYGFMVAALNRQRNTTAVSQLSQVEQPNPAFTSDKTRGIPDQRDTKLPPPYSMTDPNEPVALRHIPPGQSAGKHQNSFRSQPGDVIISLRTKNFFFFWGGGGEIHFLFLLLTKQSQKVCQV